MQHQEILLSSLVVLVMVSMVTSSAFDPADHRHGGVKMGVADHECDDAETNLDIDWGGSAFEYTCQPKDKQRIMEDNYVEYVKPVEESLPRNRIPQPFHRCMDEEIVYKDNPPMAGAHRPLWPVFGEYLYLPPQRWVHSLEHGAAVFLYHPCADQRQVESMRELATSCLWKHIITPSRDLGHDGKFQFAVVTYGHRLMMNRFDRYLAKRFVMSHALKAPEWRVTKDGTYKYKLITKAVERPGGISCDSKKGQQLTAEHMNHDNDYLW